MDVLDKAIAWNITIPNVNIQGLQNLKNQLNWLPTNEVTTNTKNVNENDSEIVSDDDVEITSDLDSPEEIKRIANIFNDFVNFDIDEYVNTHSEIPLYWKNEEYIREVLWFVKDYTKNDEDKNDETKQDPSRFSYFQNAKVVDYILSNSKLKIENMKNLLQDVKINLKDIEYAIKQNNNLSEDEIKEEIKKFNILLNIESEEDLQKYITWKKIWSDITWNLEQYIDENWLSENNEKIENWYYGNFNPENQKFTMARDIWNSEFDIKLIQSIINQKNITPRWLEHNSPYNLLNELHNNNHESFRLYSEYLLWNNVTSLAGEYSVWSVWKDNGDPVLYWHTRVWDWYQRNWSNSKYRIIWEFNPWEIVRSWELNQISDQTANWPESERITLWEVSNNNVSQIIDLETWKVVYDRNSGYVDPLLNNWIESEGKRDYFNWKLHQFEVTESQARWNSEMMDNLLSEINEQNKSQKLEELRKQISEQYKQSTWEDLQLTDEQLFSILDAHEQDWKLWELTLWQLRQKVKVLDDTITDPKVRRFLLEAWFCGKIEIISDIQNNIPSFLNKYRKSSINFEFSKNNPELHESFIKTWIITKLTNYTDITIEKWWNPELLEILKQVQEELENLPYEERLKTITNINYYLESAKKANSFINLVKRWGTTAKELFLRTRWENTNRIAEFEWEITVKQYRNSIVFEFEKSSDVIRFFDNNCNWCHFASNIAWLDTIMINKENCKKAENLGMNRENAENRTILHESQHTINKFFMTKTTDITYKEAIDPKKTDIETFKQYALDRAKDEIIAQYTNRLIIKNLSTETISILSKWGWIKELLTTEWNTYDYFKKRRNTPEEKKVREEHIEKVKNLIDCIDETFKTLSKSWFNSDTNIQNVLNLFSCTNITERKNIQNMVNNKFNINNYFDWKSQKIFKWDTTKAEQNSQTSDRILSEINEQNELEKLEELRKQITEQYKQTTWEDLQLTDEQLLSILDAHEQDWVLWELTIWQLRQKVKILNETITDPKVRRFLLEAWFCGQEKIDTKTNVEHLEELWIKIPEYSKERFNKMNLDFELLRWLTELWITSIEIINVSQFIKFDITKLKHFQELWVKINEGNILSLNEANLNDKEIINFRELQKIWIEVYEPEILNWTEFNFQKLWQLKKLWIYINKYNIIELNKAEINFQILKRLENIWIKLSDEDIIGISSDKIEINIDKLEQLKEIWVDINEDNAIELNGTDYNFDKLRYLKEIWININEDNIAELNEAEINIDKLEQLKEIWIDINEDNVIELNGTDYNFDKLRYLKEIWININEKNITKLNKINNENILMLKKIWNEKVQVIIKHKWLDVTSKPEWFIKHINIFTVPDVMSRVAELNKMWIIISYDNHNLLIPKNFKKIKQFSELWIDVSKDSELCLNTEITQDIIKRLNTLKWFWISPVRLKAINRINNLENRWIETNDILSQEYTVNYKEYGIKEDEIKANLQYKKWEIIEKIQQYIQNAISKKENIWETEIINRIRTNLMVLPKIERLNLLTTISEVVEKSNNIRKYIDFENWPYKDKYPNAKTLLCAIRGITEPNIIDKITDDVTVIQHWIGLNFFVWDEKSYQIIKDKSLTNSKIESGWFNTTASKIKELEWTLSVINWKDPGKDTKQFEYNAVWHEWQHNRNSYFMPDKYGSRIAYSKDEILAYSRDWTSIKEIEETLTTPENKWWLYQYNLKWKERENHKKQVKELLWFANDLFELANNSKTWLTRDKVLSMLSDTPANERKNLHATITDALKIHIERSTNQTNFDQSKIRELKERFINKIKERAWNNKLINNLLDFWNSTFSEYKINPEELWWAWTAKKETVVNEIKNCSSINEIKHILNNPKYSHIGRWPDNKWWIEISAIIDEVVAWNKSITYIPADPNPNLDLRTQVQRFIK